MPTLFTMSGYLVWVYAYINIYTLAFLLLQIITFILTTHSRFVIKIIFSSLDTLI